MTDEDTTTDDAPAADPDGTPVENPDDSTTDESAEESADALAEADVDWEMAPESDLEFPPDADKREFLREIAEDVRGDSSESHQVAAILYRISDLYDPEEDTSPEEIYLNVRHIMQIKEQGGIER